MAKNCPVQYTDWSKGYYGGINPVITKCDANCKAKYGPEYKADYKDVAVPFIGGYNRYCRCKRYVCLGKDTNCCTTGKSGDPQKRCDTKYTNLTSSCNPAMTKYCDADRFFVNDRCIKWAKQNPNIAEVQKRTVCNTVDGFNKNINQCRTWCLAHPGECDIGSAGYCAVDQNKQDSYCSCLQNSIVKEVGEQYFMPECNDKKCKEQGYKNKNAALIVASGKCPDIFDCSAIVNLTETARDNILNNVTQTVNCDRKQTTGGGNSVTGAVIKDVNVENKEQTADTDVKTVPIETVNTFSSVETALKVLLFIIILFVFVFLIYQRFQVKGNESEIEYGRKVANLREGELI